MNVRWAVALLAVAAVPTLQAEADPSFKAPTNLVWEPTCEVGQIRLTWTAPPGDPDFYVISGRDFHQHETYSATTVGAATVALITPHLTRTFYRVEANGLNDNPPIGSNIVGGAILEGQMTAWDERLEANPVPLMDVVSGECDDQPQIHGWRGTLGYREEHGNAHDPQEHEFKWTLPECPGDWILSVATDAALPTYSGTTSRIDVRIDEYQLVPQTQGFGTLPIASGEHDVDVFAGRLPLQGLPPESSLRALVNPLGEYVLWARPADPSSCPGT